MEFGDWEVAGGREGLSECEGGAGEELELGFQTDVPVCVVFQNEGCGDVFADDSGGSRIFLVAV